MMISKFFSNKLLSSVLTIVLIVGGLLLSPVEIKNSLASVSGDIWEDSAPDKANQVVINPSGKTTEDGRIEYRKSIINTNKDEFTISLDLITQNPISEINGVGATVVLVMDGSGSMLNSAGDTNTILYHAQEAAKIFAEKFLGTSLNNKIGLVSFASTASDELQIPFAPKGPSLTSDITKYKESVDNITVGVSWDTNIQDGLRLARKILRDDTSGNPQYIVLLSDGAANVSYRAATAFPLGLTTIKPYTRLDGSEINMSFRLFDFDYYFPAFPSYTLGENNEYFVNKHYIPTVSEGIITKEDDIDIYTIFFRNPNLSSNEYDEGVFAMTNIATGNQYHELNDATKLELLYAQLEESIVSKTSLWKITDPMGDYITFSGFRGDSRGADYNPVDSTLVWNLLNTDIVPVEIDGRYKYSLSYDIILNSGHGGFQNGVAYPANKTTSLYYNYNDGSSATDNKTLEFDVPWVCGETPGANRLQVVPRNMVAYQGGYSESGNTFPRPYFNLKNDSGTDLSRSDIDGLTFYVDGERFEPFNHSFFIYEYPFRASYVNKETGEIHSDPKEELDKEDEGLYYINITTTSPDAKHVVTAIDNSHNIYYFLYNKTAELEIRPENTNVTTVFTKPLVGTAMNKVMATVPMVYIEPGTTLKNSAGVPLEDLYSPADLRLMIDDLLDSNKTGIASAVSEQPIMHGKNYEAVYLNLVDHSDGNHIVEPDKPVTILYPYPKGTNKSTQFTVLHFYEINRGVGKDVSHEIEILDTVNMDSGIAFKVSQFSPFIIGYASNIFNVIYDLNGGVGKAPLSQYDSITVNRGTKLTKPYDPVRDGYVFIGWEVTAGSVSKLWSFDNDVVTGSMVLKAKWIYNGDTTNGNGDSRDNGGSWGGGSGLGTTPAGSGKTPQLNKYDHFAYMIGYPEGAFKSSENMTRGEAASMFARLMVKQMNVDKTYYNRFSDVNRGKWYYNAISYLQHNDVIKDKSDIFRPEDYITRAEFAVLAAGFEQLGDVAIVNRFADVPINHWAAKEISFASEKGWIKGYDDGSFKPEQYITRGEVVTLANRVLERNADIDFVRRNPDLMMSFSDVEESQWDYFEIMEAVNGHYYKRDDVSGEKWISIWK